jgi:GNAT superfamily N-acetyltransferase
MKVVIEDLTEGNMVCLPDDCKGCVYWESPEVFAEGRNEPLKKKWLLDTLREFGNCGKIVYFNSKVVGVALYGPSDRFPNVREYRSGRVGTLSEGVVLLTCLFIADIGARGWGFGRRLLEEVIEDLKMRGFKALETFARRGNTHNPSGPMQLYLRMGLYVKNDMNPEFPLMRFELAAEKVG